MLKWKSLRCLQLLAKLETWGKTPLNIKSFFLKCIHCFPKFLQGIWVPYLMQMKASTARIQCDINFERAQPRQHLNKDFYCINYDPCKWMLNTAFWLLQGDVPAFLRVKLAKHLPIWINRYLNLFGMLNYTNVKSPLVSSFLRIQKYPERCHCLCF